MDDDNYTLLPYRVSRDGATIAAFAYPNAAATFAASQLAGEKDAVTITYILEGKI